MDDIEIAFREKNYEQLIKLLNSYMLLGDHIKTSRASWFLGSYYELFDNSSSRYLTAEQYYRQAIKYNPHNLHQLDLFALLIKSKNADFNEVKQLLDDVNPSVNVPIINLAYGALYFYSIPPDYNRAKKYFVSAASKGYINGMFGYSICSRKLGHPIKALFIDFTRIIATPILKLTLGYKSRMGYYWSDTLEPFLRTKVAP